MNLKHTFNYEPNHWLTQALENWGRWLSVGRPVEPRIPGCLSLEGRYRAPDWESDEPKAEPVNVMLAEVVDSAYHQLSDPKRIALGYFYARYLHRPEGDRVWLGAKRMGWTAKRFRDELRMAIIQIGENLDKLL